MVKTRRQWLNLMLKIAAPVLLNLAEGKLRPSLPAVHPERAQYACLEAFGRTLTGMAPWLESDADGEEAALKEKYRALARQCIDKATDPLSPDRMNFTEGYGQSLVDAAFLAHAVVRAPQELYFKIPAQVKKNLTDALRSTRKFEPYPTNWLFFSAMIECALFTVGESYELAPVERAFDAFESYYKGDGAYGDGEAFRFDYYNSFVIHPMYVDIVRTFEKTNERAALLMPKVLARAARYATVLERVIAPDGTYPIVGRSVCYRFGAFHALAQAAQEEFLPSALSYPQVRCALSAVLSRAQKSGLFDENGFLTVGVAGKQPGLAEFYICVGSLYLCSAVFLPLGLSPHHPFWTGSDTQYTSQKIWSGQDTAADHAED